MEYRLARRIGGKGALSHQFHLALRGVATGGGRVCAVGDAAVKVFSPDGDLLGQWATGLPGECVAVDGQERIWVGQRQRVEVFHPKGGTADTWRDPERLGCVLLVAETTSTCEPNREMARASMCAVLG